MNDFNDLQWFLWVVKHKSFAATADKFNVSKSVISKYISRLEKNLGVQLLNRTTRKLNLTEAGQRVYQKALHIDEEFEQIKQLAKTHADEAAGKLKINAPYSLGHEYIVPVVAAFMKKYPKIFVELLLGGYLSDLIDDGMDIVFYTKLPQQQNIVIKKIMNYKEYLAATSSYLKQHGIPKKIDDLSQHNCLAYKSLDHKRSWYFFDDKEKEVEFVVNGTFSANSSRALLKAALNNMGVVKLPGYIIQNYITNKELVSLLSSHCQHEKSVYMAWASTSFLPRKNRVFIDFVTEYFEKNNWKK